MNETKIRELLQAMKVAELKKESHERGLTLEKNGKKFTKAQLIEQIVQYEYELENGKVEEKKEMQTEKNHGKGMSLEDLKDFKLEVTEEVETQEQEIPETEDTEPKRKPYVPAKTLEEIMEKYGKEKPPFVYDEILKVGAYVVFVHTVEARNGNYYDKLRKAKVVGVNRKKRVVKVETAMGMELLIPFEALLCIAEDEKAKIPKDVNDYLYNQRRENREYKQKRGYKNKTRWEYKQEDVVETTEDDEAW